MNTADKKLGIVLIVVGLICVATFAILSINSYTRFRHKPPSRYVETNVSLIQSWMTIKYISRVYKIPMPEFIDKLSLDKNDENLSVLQYANKKNLDVEVVLSNIKLIIIEFQDRQIIKPPEITPLQKLPDD